MRLDRGAGFISKVEQQIKGNHFCLKGKLPKEDIIPYYIRDILPGTQQNMLRTVTSVSGALSEYIENIRV